MIPLSSQKAHRFFLVLLIAVGVPFFLTLSAARFAFAAPDDVVFTASRQAETSTSTTTPAKDGLLIRFIDVGQGDAALVSCEGQHMLIDGGNAMAGRKVQSLLENTLGIGYLKYIVCSHAHIDHVGGLPGALKACTVGTVYCPVVDDHPEAFYIFKKFLRKQSLGITIPKPGMRFSLGAAFIEVLGPIRPSKKAGDMSLVLKLTYGDVSVLFTGGMGFAEEQDLLNAGVDLRATLLKVAHYGSNSSTSEAFLQAVNPAYAVISVGISNGKGYPSTAVLGRLNASGAKIYRTDTHGTIVCRSDGKTMVIQTHQ